MIKLLQAAGAPTHVLRLVPDIVDTCRVCRAFKRPGPVNGTTSRLVTAFNEVVQHDLLFVDSRPSSGPIPQEPQARGGPRPEEPQAQVSADMAYPSRAAYTEVTHGGASSSSSNPRKDPWQHLLDTSTDAGTHH